MQNNSQTLPIDQILPELTRRFASEEILILQADPGAGKTTRVPLALMEQPYVDGKILLLEPRRIAARSAARYMAQSLGEPVGQRVGYSMRLERKVSHLTQIEVITEGLLTRRLLSDPELRGVSLVIFDEFHERSIHTDLGLALCREAAALRDKPLRLLVMSATIDSEQLSQRLGGASVLSSPGRNFPIEIHRAARPIKQRQIIDELERRCSTLDQTDGDVLVFLPGRSEINQLKQRLEERWRSRTEVEIIPLFSGIDDHRLRPLLSAPPRGQVRFILATSIAQTSITLPGVRCVVDSGLERRPRYDQRLGLSRLETQRISKATATQRAGRAGRISAGRCFQLWSNEQQLMLRDHDRPEITEVDLSDTLLSLLSWGVHEIDGLEWIESPEPALWQAALDKLDALEAIEWRNQRPQLSGLGKLMAQISVECRVARLLVEAQQKNAGQLGAQLAALITEPAQITATDIETGLSAFKTGHHSRLCQLAQRFERQISCSSTQAALPSELLISAYADRIAERVDESQGRFRLRSGIAVRLDPTDALCRSPYLICIELGGRADQAELRLSLGARCDLPLIRTQLQDQIVVETLLRWEGERLRALRVERLGKIELSHNPTRSISAGLRAQAWCRRIASEGLNLLPGWSELLPWLARVRYLQQHQHRAPELLELEDFSDKTLISRLETWLAPALTEVNQRSDLAQLQLKPLLLALLPWQINQWLDLYVPVSYQAPTGRKLEIDYESEIPRIAVKLQEMFGVQESPRTGLGLPIRVELLSPAGRPLAITTDLQHFWKNTYPQVRKENRGRYSKHPWPEDPINAAASHLSNAALRRQQQG